MANKAASWDSRDCTGGGCEGALFRRVDDFLFGGFGDCAVFIVGDSEEEEEDVQDHPSRGGVLILYMDVWGLGS